MHAKLKKNKIKTEVLALNHLTKKKCNHSQ